MPGHLFCVFGPSNFQAAAILNFDVKLHPSKNIVQREMVTKESSVPKPLASSRNIQVIISQNQARMRCNWVRMSPAKRFSVTNWWQFAKGSDSTWLKRKICCREIETVAVLCEKFEHLNCITDHSQTRTQSLLGGGREETQRILGRKVRGAQRVMGRTNFPPSSPQSFASRLKATGYESGPLWFWSFLSEQDWERATLIRWNIISREGAIFRACQKSLRTSKTDPHKMFRFPSPSASKGLVGRSEKKKMKIMKLFQSDTVILNWKLFLHWNFKNMSRFCFL